jgi:signal transduction histidine kinase
MNFYAGFCFVSSFLIFLFGFFVFLQKIKNKLNQFWFLFNLFVAIWLGALGETMATKNSNIAFIFQKILYIGTILIPVYFVNFSLILTRKENKKITKLNFLFASFFLIILFFTNLFIRRIKEMIPFGYWPVEVGPLYYPFLIWFAALVIYGFILLKRGYKNIKIPQIEREQIRFIFYGLLIGFLAGSLNFLLDFNVNIPPFYNLFVPFYLGFVGYAIATKQLFGIKVILADFLIWIMALTLFFEIFIFPNFKFQLIHFSVFSVFLIFAYYLVKSVHEEEKRREKAEMLAQKESELREKYQVLAIRLIAIEKKLREIAERERILREEAEKLSQAKTEFIAIASHQLRTPLTVISGYLSMILDGDYGEISQKIKDIIKKVLQSAQRLIRLVNSILDISKIEAGEIEMNWQRVDLREIAREVIEELKIKAKQKNLNLDLKEPKEKIENLVDREKIREVLFNLVDNAIKYTQEGKITLILKRETKKNVDQIWIKDTGEGLTKEEKEKLFKRFSRGAAGIKFWVEGTGLGLFISKSFVELHGGKIWVESEGKSKGTTFYIELPIR